MNALKIFSENFVNGDCTITANSGNATLPYIYDQKQATFYITSGSSDGVSEYVQVMFFNWQGSAIAQTFNRIILLNTNFKAITADYWDGANWQAISEASLTLSVANKIIEIATPISGAYGFRILCTTVQSGTEKYLSELKICQSILTGSQLWRSDLPRNDDQRAGNFRVGDGGLTFWREWTKFGAAGTIYDLAKADHDLLFPYLKTASFITVVFYEDFDLTECYEVAIVNPPNHRLNRKTQLYDQISLELKER